MNTHNLFSFVFNRAYYFSLMKLLDGRCHYFTTRKMTDDIDAIDVKNNPSQMSFKRQSFIGKTHIKR